MDHRWRKPHTRWNLSRLDQLADLGRLARVEVDVALADAGLLRQQPGLQQRLPHLLRQRAIVAREAARQVGELGVIAAPLAHPVEPLEDPARRAQAGIRVLVRARDLAVGAEQVQHGVLDLVVAARRVPAEARDGLGDPQRVARRRSARAARRRRSRPAAAPARSRAGGRSAGPARRSTSSTNSGSSVRRREGQGEEAAAEIARAQAQVGRARAARRARRARRACPRRPRPAATRGRRRRRGRRAAPRAPGARPRRFPPWSAIATCTGVSLPERGLASSTRPARSASASTSRRRALAEGGAAAPPQASSSTSKAVIALPYRHGHDAPAGRRTRACAGSLLPRLDAPGGGAPGRRGVGAQHARRARSRPCSRARPRRSRDARVRARRAGARRRRRRVEETRGAPRGPATASTSDSRRTVAGRWRPPHHFANRACTC